MKKYIKIIKSIVKKTRAFLDVPKNKALVKLGLYAIMFLLIFILARISSFDKDDNKKDLKEKIVYSTVLDNTRNKSADIEYIISSGEQKYVIDGELKDNTLKGYIEKSDEIKKIIIKENELYIINNSTEEFSEDLNKKLVVFFLIPNNIFELIDNNHAYIEKKEDINIYTYNTTYNEEEYEIKITANYDYITNIIISNDSTTYDLSFIFDK